MESADREPIVQAASQAWIVIGFAPIPDRPVRHDQINQATRERCWLVSSLAGLRTLADVVGIEAGAVMLDGPKPAGELVGQGHGGLVVALPLLHVDGPCLQWIQSLSAPGDLTQAPVRA